MGSNGASGAGGSDAGFKNSVETRNKKANEKNLGTSDYQGDLDSKGRSKNKNNNNNNGGNDGVNNSNVVVQAPKVISPTTAEVSQAAPEVTSEEARASANELILKKRRGRGRSSTILTSTQGVQDNKGLTLGKPSLLG